MKIELEKPADKAKNTEKGRMLCDVIGFHLPSLGMIAVELSRLASLFSRMRRFESAGVGGHKWKQKANELAGPLFHSLEI